MICPNCKKEIADDSIYCAGCGQRLSEDTLNSQNAPQSQKELAASGQPKPKKKFIKPLTIVAGVFLAAAVAVFCGWVFARADLIRFFLGNTRYAVAFAKGTITAIADNGYADSVLISALSSSFSTGNEQYEKYEQYVKDHPDNKLSYHDYEEILYKVKFLSSLQQLLPENGIYIKTGIKAEPEEKLYKLAAETLHIDREEIEKAFAALDLTAVEGYLSVKEDGLDLSYLISQKEEQLDSGDLYYNTKEGSLYYLDPSVYGSALRTEVQALNIDSENNKYKIDNSKTEKERKALIKQLSDIYFKHLQNARTYYSDTVEAAGKGEFKGKSMAVTFEDDTLIELFRDITNAFYDSDYFTDIMKAVFDGTVPGSIDIDGLKERAGESLDGLMTLTDKLSLTLEFYINTDNSFAGLSIRSSSVNGDDSYSTQIKYINTKTDIYAEVTAGDNTYIKIEGAKSSDKSGALNIGINLPKNSKRDEDRNLDIAVKYSDLGHKKVFGKNQLLGIFNIDVSGSLLDELSLRSDAVDYGTLAEKSGFTISAKDSMKGIEYGIEIKNESYGNVTVTAEIGENKEHVFDRRSMTLDEAVIMKWDNTKTLEAKTGLLKHYRDLWDKNELLKVCFEYALGKSYIEGIDEEIEKLENNLKYKAVYSNYDENKSTWLSRIYAQDVYRNLTILNKPLNLKSKEPVTVKIYYDSAGRMNIIDLAGEDESLLKTIKNLHLYKCYAEIIFCYETDQYAPVGINLVLTNSMDSIPENLPTVFNYTYQIYPWGNDFNYIDPYVVGTYPDLKRIDPNDADNIVFLSEEVDRYNEYAQRGFEAFNSYLNDTGNSLIYPDNYVPLPIKFMIQSGEWLEKYDDHLIPRYFKNPFETEALHKYLKENVPEIEDGYLILYIYDNKVVGASFSDIDDIHDLCSAVYMAGVTSEWGIIDGVTDNVYENWHASDPKNYAIGTYPVIKSYNGTLSEEIKELMKGNWVKLYDDTQTITVTEDDIKHITRVTTFVNGNLGFKFSFDDGTKYSVSLNITGLLFYEDKPYYKSE